MADGTAAPVLDPVLSCKYCGRKLESGYYFTCHVCGANYCYIHMRKHDGAHPRLERAVSG